MKDLTIIIPTLNEEKNIGRLITLLFKLYSGVFIIVADDGSIDGTSKVVSKFKKNVRFLDRASKSVKGLTVSVMDAVKLVKTKYFVVIDGDMQHPPEKISEIYSKLNRCDVVIGRRIKIDGYWSLYRRLMSKVASTLGFIRLLLHGIYVRDCMSGFFGARTKLFRDVVLKHGGKFEKLGYKVLFDFLKYVHSVKICYVGYVFRQRSVGSSKIRFKHVLYFFRSLFK